MARKRGLADRRRVIAEQAETLGEKELKKRFGGTRTAAVLQDEEVMAHRRAAKRRKYGKLGS